MNTADRSAPDGEEALWDEVSAHWPELHRSELIPTHGAYHQVGVFPGVAVVRVSTGAGHHSRSLREAASLTAIGVLRLPAEVPHVLGPVKSGHGWSAVALSYLPGRRRQAEDFSEVGTELGRVLNAIHAVPAERCAGLPPVREWCGGADWPSLVGRICAKLGRPLRSTALDAVRAVLGSEAGAPVTLVHGDFGMHNLLWLGESVTGIIDFDTACVGDPAMDVASLLGVYDREELAAIADADTLKRAAIHQRSLPLQVAAAAEIADDSSLRDHALTNFADRERERSFGSSVW